MAKINIAFPDEVLEGLARLAAARGVSRNRVIVEACRSVLGREERPTDGFFSRSHLSDADLRLLREGGEDFDRAIMSARRSRRESPF